MIESIMGMNGGSQLKRISFPDIIHAIEGSASWLLYVHSRTQMQPAIPHHYLLTHVTSDGSLTWVERRL